MLFVGGAAARTEVVLVFPEVFDPVLFGVLSAAVEEEAAAAYEAGFSDGLRSAAWQSPDETEDDLGPPGEGFDAAGPVGDDDSPLARVRGQ